MFVTTNHSYINTYADLQYKKPQYPTKHLRKHPIQHTTTQQDIRVKVISWTKPTCALGRQRSCKKESQPSTTCFELDQYKEFFIYLMTSYPCLLF